MDEDDDLLTPYKEESYEIYEKRMTDESDLWITTSSSSEDEVEVDTPILIAPTPPIVHEQENHPIPVENGNIRKRGRPRKRKIPTPPISEPLPAQESYEPSEPFEEKKDIVNGMGPDDSLETTVKDEEIEIPSAKRKLGRPRKDEITVNSQKKMLQTLRCIIPDGVKRKARPSCMLDDFEAFMLKEDSRDSFHKTEVYIPSFKGRMNGKRGRPRIHPVKIKALLPDGRPRGRGRPRICELPGSLTESTRCKPIKPKKSSKEQIIRNYPGCSPFTLSGAVRQRYPRPGKKLGRPRKGQEKTHKIPINRDNIDATNTHVNNELNCGTSQPDDGPSKPTKAKIEQNEHHISKEMKLGGTKRKRVAGPGKKLGRPRKGEERNSNILKNQNKKSIRRPWKIKLKGLFKTNQFSNATQSDETIADDEQKLKVEPETEVDGLEAIDAKPDQDLTTKSFRDNENSDEDESSSGSSIYEIVHDAYDDSNKKENGNCAPAAADSVRSEDESPNCAERITPRSPNSPMQKDGKETSASKSHSSDEDIKRMTPETKLANGVDPSKNYCNKMALSKLLKNSSLEISNSGAFPANEKCKSTKNQTEEPLPSSHNRYNSPKPDSCFESNRNSERAGNGRVNYALSSPYQLEMSES